MGDHDHPVDLYHIGPLWCVSVPWGQSGSWFSSFIYSAPLSTWKFLRGRMGQAFFFQLINPLHNGVRKNGAHCNLYMNDVLMILANTQVVWASQSHTRLIK